MGDKIKQTLYVCHGMYGCETGCCGYRLCTDDEGDGRHPDADFEFSHPKIGQDARSFAEDMWPDLVTDDVEVLPGKWWVC